jgi:5-methylcytosine-specific restriction protein B
MVMTDEEILDKFRDVPEFKHNVSGWREETISEFCQLVRYAHEKELDVFAIRSSPVIRIGRKRLDAVRSLAVWGTFELTSVNINLALRYEHQDKYWYKTLSTGVSEQVIAGGTIDRFTEAYPSPGQHYWPEDYTLPDEEDSVGNATAFMAEQLASKPALNQILYGPPGTGKTYHTIEIAVKAAEPERYAEITAKYESTSSEYRQALKDIYEHLVGEKRVRFVTFHQNYGYEEFVEGLRAKEEDGTIQYKVEPGIFRAIVDSAKAKTVSTLINTSAFNLDGRKIWKMSLGNTQTNEGDMVFNECLEKNWILLGYGGDIDFTGCNTAKKIKVKLTDAGYDLKPQDYNVTSVNTFINKLSVGDIVIISEGNHKFRAIAEVTSDYEYLNDERDWYYQKRDVRWLMVFDESRPVDELFSSVLSQMTLYHLKDSVVSREKLAHLLNESKQELETVKNYVLIIDEINRGNISKIFGELITLIEPSKRAGAPEGLSVTLPCSQEPFSVPDNLYIIGTMNTADRSLAMLDTALRRRFDFVPMMPDLTLLDDVVLKVKGESIDLRQLLGVMNQRIEILYDREHTLGHAFFMPVKALLEDELHEEAFAEFVRVFRHKIVPLLEEYFFEDWDKIRLVLGDNQKGEDASLQFIVKTELKPDCLKDLFGAQHGLDQFGQAYARYRIQSDLAQVWQNPVAYRMIYQPDQTEL